MSRKLKVIRTATVGLSLDVLLKGQLEFLNQHFKVTAVSGLDTHLNNVKNREGVKTVNIKISRSISLLKDIKSLFKLYKFFKSEKPDMVHSITPKAGLLSMLAAKMANVPVRIHTFTGLYFPTQQGFMKFVLIQMDRLLCKVATKVIPEGEGVKSDLLKFKITNKPLQIIANGNINGINTTYFNPKHFSEKQNQALRQDLGIHKDNFIFIFVGRLVGDKGINELIAAFKAKRSLERSRKAKLLLVGPLESQLDPLQPKTLQEIESNPNIITTGFQADVRPYFAIADALVFPSYREGFPNVVMQAGAMGLPSIVTDINGCNEIVEDGKNGIIIPPKDTEAIQQAMFKLTTETDVYEGLKSNAREMITSRFEQNRVWEALLEEYKQLLKDKGFEIPS